MTQPSSSVIKPPLRHYYKDSASLSGDSVADLFKNTLNTSNTVVGSGPFILDSFVKGSGSRLSKRADYHWGPGYATHQGPAWLDGIEFKYLPETAVRLGALNSGQVQAIDAIPPVNYAQVTKNTRLQVITRENPGVNRVLYLNIAQGPFKDVKVRQAFQSSVNSEAAVQATFFGTVKPAHNVLGPTTVDYDPSVAASWGSISIKLTACLMKRAGRAKTARAIARGTVIVSPYALSTSPETSSRLMWRCFRRYSIR